MRKMMFWLTLMLLVAAAFNLGCMTSGGGGSATTTTTAAGTTTTTAAGTTTTTTSSSVTTTTSDGSSVTTEAESIVLTYSGNTAEATRTFLATTDAVIITFSTKSAGTATFSIAVSTSAGQSRDLDALAVDYESEPELTDQQRLSLLMREQEKELVEQYGRAADQIAALGVNEQIAPQFVQGSTEVFYYYDFNTSSYSTVAAEAVQEGDHCYAYVESGLLDASGGISTAALSLLVDEFDDNSYPSAIQNFGESGSIEGDTKVTLLFMDLGTSLFGYFDSRNELNIANSNYRKMLVLNGTEDFSPLAVMAPTMVHEFQHLINYHNKGTESTWLNEGFSMYAEQLAGYGMQPASGSRGVDAHGLSAGQIDYFTALGVHAYQSSRTSLTSWGGGNEDYGASYLFTAFLYDTYGSSILKRIITSESTSITCVAEEAGRTFDALFRDFAIANYYTYSTDVDLGVYTSIDLSQTYTLSYNMGGFAGNTVSFNELSDASVTTLPYSGSTVTRAIWNPYYVVIGSVAGDLDMQVTQGTNAELYGEIQYGNFK